MVNKNVAKLNADLALAEKSLKNPMIDKNPTLKKSLEEKIKGLKAQIAATEDIAGEKTTSKPAAEKAEKKEVAKPAAKKEEKPAVKTSANKGLKIGDTVSFFYKKTGKNRKGEVIYIHPSKGTATVKHADGVSYPKVGTVTIEK